MKSWSGKQHSCVTLYCKISEKLQKRRQMADHIRDKLAVCTCVCWSFDFDQWSFYPTAYRTGQRPRFVIGFQLQIYYYYSDQCCWQWFAMICLPKLQCRFRFRCLRWREKRSRARRRSKFDVVLEPWCFVCKNKQFQRNIGTYIHAILSYPMNTDFKLTRRV